MTIGFGPSVTMVRAALVSLFFCIATLCLSTSMACAGPSSFGLPRASLEGSPATGGKGQTGLRFEYVGFASEAMREVYDYPLAFMGEGLIWGERNMGVGFEMGLFSAEGTPALAKSDWRVRRSKISTTVVPTAVDVLYRFRRASSSSPFIPHVGLGPVLWIGTERLSASASRRHLGIDEAFDAGLTAIGVNFGMQFILGSSVRLGGDVLGVIEVRWAQSFTKGTEDLVEEEDKGLIEPALYGAVRRSDFDFSGWRFGLGARW